MRYKVLTDLLSEDNGLYALIKPPYEENTAVRSRTLFYDFGDRRVAVTPLPYLTINSLAEELKSRRRESNPQPTDYKSVTLPIEPRRLIALRSANRLSAFSLSD